MSNIRQIKGFTLVEVVIVLTVMAVMAISALPRMINIIEGVSKASRDYLVAQIRSGLHHRKFDTVEDAVIDSYYPATLDSGAPGVPCNVDPCFTEALDTGQETNNPRWVRDATPNHYQYSAVYMLSTFEYNSANGTFICVSGNC